MSCKNKHTHTHTHTHTTVPTVWCVRINFLLTDCSQESSCAAPRISALHARRGRLKCFKIGKKKIFFSPTNKLGSASLSELCKEMF